MEKNQDRDLLAIGYWFGRHDPKLPLPELFIGDPWNEEEKKATIEHIKKGKEYATSAGFSTCRICKQIMGSRDYSDGLFIYPAKFEHYIEVHNLKPPKAFIDHALNRLNHKAFNEQLNQIKAMPQLQEFQNYKFVIKDISWWIFQEMEYLGKLSPEARQEYLQEKSRRLEEFNRPRH